MVFLVRERVMWLKVGGEGVVAGFGSVGVLLCRVRGMSRECEGR